MDPDSRPADCFQLYPWRFSFVAKEPIFFPAGKAANVLRGALGSIFRGLVCTPDCPGAKACEHRSACPYARIFEPSAGEAGGPSGLADWPRPFVFRASHLDGATLKAGERFYFDLHVFDLLEPVLAYFVLTFSEIAREGLGPRRGRAELAGVSQLRSGGEPPVRLFDRGTFLRQEGLPPLIVPLEGARQPVAGIDVRFHTPTELKAADTLVSRPEFGAFFARARDRVSTLMSLYGGGPPLDLDFRAMGDRADAVRMTRCDLRDVEAERRSSRTGQTHSLGGFVGDVSYEGDLTEFVGILRAAEWCGVGRQTVWGKGVFSFTLRWF